MTPGKNLVRNNEESPLEEESLGSLQVEALLRLTLENGPPAENFFAGGYNRVIGFRPQAKSRLLADVE